MARTQLKQNKRTPSPPGATSAPRSERRWTALAIAIGLAVVTFVVYSGALSAEFSILDDDQYVRDNPRVSRGLSAENIAWAFTHQHAAMYHPLTTISHMIDVSLFDLRPAPHHAVNVALHAANCMLVFLVLLRWTGREGASFAVAALFAVHPLHVESVAWIVERKDVLSAFFGLTALLAWTGWARNRSRGAHLFALVLFAAALMSKPMLVTLPFVMLVADVWPLQRKAQGWRRLVLEKLPFFALTAISCVLTWRAQSAGGAIQTAEQLPLLARLANAVASYGWYVGKTIWPTSLAFHYPLVTGRVNGTGLGLAVAQDVVTRHGGLIEFESEPGRTIFKLLLPHGDAQ